MPSSSKRWQIEKHEVLVQVENSIPEKAAPKNGRPDKLSQRLWRLAEIYFGHEKGASYIEAAKIMLKDNSNYYVKPDTLLTSNNPPEKAVMSEYRRDRSSADRAENHVQRILTAQWEDFTSELPDGERQELIANCRLLAQALYAAGVDGDATYWKLLETVKDLPRGMSQAILFFSLSVFEQKLAFGLQAKRQYRERHTRPTLN